MKTRKLRYLLGLVVAGLALSAPVAAQSTQIKDPFDALEAINPEVLFKGIIREDDVSLLFKHVRESMTASMRGEEPRESAAITRRTEEIQRELATRGTVLVGVLLSAFESAARQAIREAMTDMSSRKPRPPHPASPPPGNY
jgi:hypothetical protein